MDHQRIMGDQWGIDDVYSDFMAYTAFFISILLIGSIISFDFSFCTHYLMLLPFESFERL